ncbi:MAG: B12-binding domain-containing radical SAM protein [Candidatus Pacearchaeota archaeon]|nr:MAG: B12-binding domain-containing radical SAM protein [Candidatus Pacearchaeota archaeon]
MKPKIMFINAMDITKKIEAFIPPLGLGYLASSLRKEFGFNHIKFKIVDRDIKQEINNFKPDIIGITSVTQNYNKAIEYAKIAKKHDIPVIIGGVHISALPSTLSRDMDVGVIGEGEETIIELFNLFEEKGCFDGDELEKIDGIVFRRNGELIITKKRKPIEPLDRIPMPARDLFTIKKSTSMFTSRGCPYRCTFCASSRFWDNVRFFSAEYVVNEIKYLISKYKVKNIAFWDDIFIADKRRLKQILELLKKEGILGKVNFTCSVRSNLVNNEVSWLLKQMNVKSVSMGLESGSPTTLEYLKGRNITIKDHINAINIFKKYGIKIGASFIIGSPKESQEDILRTLKFIKENRLASFAIYVLTPFPGTPVWEYAKARNLVSEDMNWNSLNVNFGESHNDAIILSEKLTRDEIYKLFLLFRNEKLKIVIKNTLKNPLKIPKRLLIALVKILSGKPLIVR